MQRSYHTRPSIGQSAGVAGVCLILAVVILVASQIHASFTHGPASADIAELRREKQMIRLCEDAIRTQQVVKRGPYEARPYGERCVVYQLVYSGGG